jgi:hypothetical protein
MKKLLSFALVTGGLLVFSPNAASPKSPDFPMQCHGGAGMATTNGKNLIIDFKAGEHPAGPSLAVGFCSWRDRGLRSNEPTRIVDERPSIGEARRTAELINAGNTWTFWVFNVGRFFKATASAQGTPRNKPVRID